MGGKGHDICALPLYHSQHMVKHTKGHDFFWGNTNTSRLILDHLARYSDETGNTFWAPMDLYAVMVNFIVRRWIDEEEKKKANRKL